MYVTHKDKKFKYCKCWTNYLDVNILCPYYFHYNYYIRIFLCIKMELGKSIWLETTVFGLWTYSLTLMYNTSYKAPTNS
jgi:hypothetical protein